MSNTKILQDAKHITQSLRRSRQSMETSLLQADEAANLIDSDGKVIKSTLDLHKGELKSALKVTKVRIHRVKQIHLLEKWSSTLSFSFFIVVVVYIIAKRMRLFLISELVFIQGYRFSSVVYDQFPGLYNKSNPLLQFMSKPRHDFRDVFKEKFSQSTIPADSNDGKEPDEYCDINNDGSGDCDISSVGRTRRGFQDSERNRLEQTFSKNFENRETSRRHERMKEYETRRDRDRDSDSDSDSDLTTERERQRQRERERERAQLERKRLFDRIKHRDSSEINSGLANVSINESNHVDIHVFNNIDGDIAHPLKDMDAPLSDAGILTEIRHSDGLATTDGTKVPQIAHMDDDSTRLDMVSSSTGTSTLSDATDSFMAAGDDDEGRYSSVASIQLRPQQQQQQEQQQQKDNKQENANGVRIEQDSEDSSNAVEPPSFIKSSPTSIASNIVDEESLPLLESASFGGDSDTMSAGTTTDTMVDTSPLVVTDAISDDIDSVSDEL